MELAKEYIKRIDDYLIRMGFEYTDIRYEMVDHIASEIEGNITDVDAFFSKNGFRGEFLMYMLSQDAKLSSIYTKQVKRKTGYDYLFLLKLTSRKFLESKTLAAILLSFISLNYLIRYNLKNTTYFILVTFSILIIYASYFYYTETKKIGKLKIIQSFATISTSLAFLGINIPLSMTGFFKQEFPVYIPFLVLTVLILQILILIVFQKHKTNLQNKYNNLLLT